MSTHRDQRDRSDGAVIAAPSTDSHSRRGRAIVAGLLSLQAAWSIYSIVISGVRFRGLPGGPTVSVAIILAIYVPAATLLLRQAQAGDRAVTRLFVVVAVLTSIRFYAPLLLLDLRSPFPSAEEQLAAAFLRELAAGQEQYRLSHGAYTTSVDSVLGQPSMFTPEVTLATRGADFGWNAIVRTGALTCRIFVRDSTLRTESRQIEGEPDCGVYRPLDEKQRERSVFVAIPGRRILLGPDDISGVWPQHLGGARRTGRSSDSSRVVSPRSWTSRVGGQLRAPVAIVGNQVFVGAHGNGEFVALTLDSGLVAWRVRAPNWIHHEPAVSKDLAIVGFGNNATPQRRLGIPIVGTPPSGVVAFERTTGRERWIRFTGASVMASPTIFDSSVIFMTGRAEVGALRLTDGHELWSTRLRGWAPMSNLLLADSEVVASIEPTEVCALNAIDGTQRFCRSLGWGWGAGHASPALAGSTIIQVMEAWSWSHLLTNLIGVPLESLDPISTLRVVSLDLRSGAILWATEIRGPRHHVVGHIAGTPTVDEGVAYIPLPTIGAIVAISTASGRLIWRSSVSPARGAVTKVHNRIFAATTGTHYVVLSTVDGQPICSADLPSPSDRSDLIISGLTGVLTLVDGSVLARPVDDWLTCRMSD
jgi:outer membrane protein assembly factor BamB